MSGNRQDRILLSHGAGGRLTHELIEGLFLNKFRNPFLEKLDDAAELSLSSTRVALTTDAFVVRPLFFPGGDIGKLAICGTVNDLAMKGAEPVAIASALIMEEGLEIEILERVVESMRKTALEIPVNIVCGDTKVVEKGSADGLFIVTTGLGNVIAKNEISGSCARTGDAVILSGPIGEHGVAVLQARGEYRFEGVVESDCAPLHDVVGALLRACRQVHVLRDPTRGGLATSLIEIARASRVRIEIEEERIPIPRSVQTASDLLGLDPLYIANEGKLIAFVPEKEVPAALKALHSNAKSRSAVQIGRVIQGPPGVEMITDIGGRRPLRMLEGEQLPRIC